MKRSKLRVGGPDPVRVFAGIIILAAAFMIVVGRPAIQAPARKRRALEAAMPDVIPPSSTERTRPEALALEEPAGTPPAVMTPAVVQSAPATPSPAAPPSSAQPRTVTFQELAGFEMPAIPEPVRALDGQNVTIEGYVMPMKMDGPRIVAFMLMSAMPNCCFGGEPRLNDWVMVGVPRELDVRASNLGFAKVTGRLTVREVKDKRGETLGLYALKATAVSASDGPGTED